jgi:hypothetical protein
VTCAVRQLTLHHFEAPTNRILDDILFAYRIVASPSTLVTVILANLRREPEKQSAYLEVGRGSTAYLFPPVFLLFSLHCCDAPAYLCASPTAPFLVL